MKAFFSPVQVIAAAKFISKNNIYIDLTAQEVYDDIVKKITQHFSDPNVTFTGTIGYTIRFEQLDCEDSDIYAEVLVDPTVSKDTEIYHSVEK